VDTTHDSPFGRIRVRWEHGSDTFRLDVDVPPGTTVEVVLPSGGTDVVASGRHTFEDHPPRGARSTQSNDRS
jgi:alpha-L-rhamnosidase